MIQNVGHSPATNVDVRVEVVNANGPNVVEIQRRLCPKSEPIVNGWGRALFPGEPEPRPFMAQLTKDKLQAKFEGFPQGTVLLNVVGCVDYTINPTEHKQTAFSYLVVEVGANGKSQPIMNGRSVPKEKVRFFDGGPVGESAD